jgi:carboxymethylenebutenolidase
MHFRMFAALLLISCSSAQEQKAGPPPGDQKPEVQREPTSPSTIGDILGEDAFKALHQLRDDAPPPLAGDMIELGQGRAYLSLPQGQQPPLAAVIVIHEWWGLNDHIKHWTDRLAQDGYAALAVDLYGGKVATTRDEAMTYMQAVDDAQARGVLQSAIAFVQKDSRIQATRIASVGWCFGGGWSLQLAMNSPELNAAVIYYGRLIDDPARLASIKAEVLGIFGDRDSGIPPAQVDAFEAALKKAGVNHTIHRYDADHGFANPSGARYDQSAATDAWQKVRDFLRARLQS